MSLRSPDPNSPDVPIVNLTTLENRQLCVAVTTCGLCIVGNAHDSLDGLPHVAQNPTVTDSPEPAETAQKTHVKLSQQVSISSAVFVEAMLVQYHETIYSLLDDVSPMYRAAFCSELTDKLMLLQRSQEDNWLRDVLNYVWTYFTDHLYRLSFCNGWDHRIYLFCVNLSYTFSCCKI